LGGFAEQLSGNLDAGWVFQPDVLRETSISTTLVQENEARNGYRGNRVTGMNYGLNVGSVQGE
jgi:hypothetical protein